MMETVACSEFVKRQTPESGFSHYDGTWSELQEIVVGSMRHPVLVREGYKKGVLLVKVPPVGFYSGIVELKEDTKLLAKYAPRSIGEAPYVKVGAKARKQKANYVEVVLYHSSVLEEDNDRSTSADWEIICIKARVSEEEEPMDPYTMARNFLHMKGGTKGDFTAEQFAQSIVYWNNHCMCVSQVSWYKSILFFLRKFIN